MEPLHSCSALRGWGVGESVFSESRDNLTCDQMRRTQKRLKLEAVTASLQVIVLYSGCVWKLVASYRMDNQHAIDKTCGAAPAAMVALTLRPYPVPGPSAGDFSWGACITSITCHIDKPLRSWFTSSHEHQSLRSGLCCLYWAMQPIIPSIYLFVFSMLLFNYVYQVTKFSSSCIFIKCPQ